jgi:hypothetical protein
LPPGTDKFVLADTCVCILAAVLGPTLAALANVLALGSVEGITGVVSVKLTTGPETFVSDCL